MSKVISIQTVYTFIGVTLYTYLVSKRRDNFCFEIHVSVSRDCLEGSQLCTLALSYNFDTSGAMGRFGGIPVRIFHSFIKKKLHRTKDLSIFTK